MAGALKSVAGVRRAETSFEKKEAYVLCDESRTDVKPMIAALQKAGYGGSFKRWGGPR